MLLKEGGKISAQSKSVLQLDRILSGNGFACFHELIKTSQLFASDLCYAGTLPVAIFCSKVEPCAEGLLCDGWMRLSVDKSGAAAIFAVRAAAKRCLDRHVCGVGIGSKSAEVDLEGVVNALSIESGTSVGGYRDDASMSSASTVQQTRVLQYSSAATAFRRELDRVGGYDRGGRGVGGVRGGGVGQFQERSGGGGAGLRDRDGQQRRGGGYGGGGDRYAGSDRGGGDGERDWRSMREGQGPPRRGGRPSESRGFGAGGMRDARLDELSSKSRPDSGSLAPSGPPSAGKYVPPSRRIL